MSKLTEQLRTVGIYNAFNFAAHGRPFISYTPNDYGRGGHSAHWSVVRPGFKTDPGGAWYDHGNKTFGVYRSRGPHPEAKREALEEAKAWAGARYGITEWARTPFGSWMDATFVKARLAELRAQLKEAEASV